MPLPKPSGGESKNQFMHRCMSELKGEFSEQDQRLAVCFKQWRGSGDSSIRDEYVADPNSFVTVTSDGIFSGYAALFNVPDMQGDMIAPGAFAKSLADGFGDVRMLFSHENDEPIGRWLLIKEDQYGLFVRGQLNLDVERARELKSLMESGAVDGLSIMGEIVAAKKTSTGEVVTELDLWEISICTFPMQKQAGLDEAPLLRAYGHRSRLPAAVRRVLPADAQEAYRRAYNRYVRVHPDGSYARAHAIAWRAVRKIWQPPHPEVGKWIRHIMSQGDCKMQIRDTVVLDGSRRTSDGYLTGNVRVARTGIQIYRGFEVGRPDLPEVRVFRPGKEVFAKDAIHSFAHRPVTLDHPSEMVNAANWKKYAIGQTGDEIARDGEFIRVPMVLMDAEAIAAVESGKKQLSMGYTCDLKWQDGVSPDGEKYDAIQTGIRANHLAVVSAARGGPELQIDRDFVEDAVSLNGEGFAYAKSLIADGKVNNDDPCDDEFSGDIPKNFLAMDESVDPESKDHFKYPFAKDGILYRSALRAIRSRASHQGADAVFEAAGKLIELIDSKKKEKEDAMSDVKLKKVEVDGLEVEVTEGSAKILQKGLEERDALIKRLRKDAASAPKEGESKTDFMARCQEAGNDESACMTAWTGDSAHKDAMAAKDAEITALKQSLKDSELTPEKLDAAVKARATLIQTAKSIHDKVETEGKTDAEIRRAVVDAKLGEKVKDWSDERIATGFETMAAFASEKTTNDDKLAEAIRDQKQPATDKDKAYEEHIDRMSNAWRNK